MIDYIKYNVNGKTYQLTNHSDGTWSKELNAPDVTGRYDLLLEIGQGGIKTYIDSKDPRYTFYLEVIKDIERKVNLLKYVPDALQKIDEFKVLFNAKDIELDIFYDQINNIILNAFIRTASNERIMRLESFLGIKGLGSLEQRKSYLLTLFQRGKKLNESVIKGVAKTIAGADCIVTFFGSDEIDNPNPGYGLLQVQILSPDNRKDYRYADIVRALKPLAPGHIKLLVVKFFATWNDIGNNFTDWNAIVKNMTDWQSIKDYIPPLE